MVALCRGKGATCKVKIRFLHPSKDVEDKYPQHSYTRAKVLQGFKVIGREMMNVNRKFQQCVVMQHKAFGDQKIHCVKKYAVVTTEGPEEDFPLH